MPKNNKTPGKSVKDKAGSRTDKNGKKNAKGTVNRSILKTISFEPYEMDFFNEFGGYVKMVMGTNKENLLIYSYIIPEDIPEDEAIMYLTGEKEMEQDTQDLGVFTELPYRIENGTLSIDTSNLIEKYYYDEDYDSFEAFEKSDVIYAFDILSKFIDLSKKLNSIDHMKESEVDKVAEKMMEIASFGTDQIDPEDQEIVMENKHIVAAALCTLMNEFLFGGLHEILHKNKIDNVNLTYGELENN